MAWKTVFSLCFLIALKINLSTAYQMVKVGDLCKPSELQHTFDQIYGNRPAVQLYNGSESGLRVYQSWNEDNLANFQDCVFNVDSNLYSEKGQWLRSLFISVNKMDFRKRPNGDCIDYIRLTFSNGKTGHICGTFKSTDQLGQSAFFNEPSGIVKVHIFVDKNEKLHGLKNVELELIFTAYEDCSGAPKGSIQCNPKDTAYCISNAFAKDDIQNCPPPYNTDEKTPRPKKHNPNAAARDSISNGLIYLTLLAFALKSIL